MKTLKLLFACFMVIGLLGASAQATIRTVPGDYDYIQDAVNSAEAGDTIMVGEYTGPGAVIDKQLVIVGSGEVSIINEVATEEAAFFIPDEIDHAADGTEISNLRIECNNDLLIGVWVIGADDIIVSHLTIVNWRAGIIIQDGSRCEIVNNNLSSSSSFPGGRVDGIILGAVEAGAYNNLIAFNKISFDGPTPDWPLENYGIWAVADDSPMEGNKIVHNKVQFVAEIDDVSYPSFAPLNGGIGLTDIRGDEYEEYDFTGNYIGFNDVRGSKNSEMALRGVDASLNSISRNLGENRSIDPADAPEDVSEFKPIIE